MTKNILDKFRGCLYGGTVGDALGYPIELRTAEQKSIFGKGSFMDYDLGKIMRIDELMKDELLYFIQ